MRKASRLNRSSEWRPLIPKSRQALFLLSGLLCDQTIWADVAAQIRPKIETHIVSFAGFDSIIQMAAHVLSVAPERFALAGHSMGGRVALEIVGQAPERVSGLALLNTGVHARRDHEVESRGRLVKLARDNGMAALAAAWLPPMMGASRKRVDELMPRLTAMVLRHTTGEFAAQIEALLNRPDAAAVLPHIAVPVLLVSGTRDTWSPIDQHAEMQRQIRGAALAIIAEAGHMAPIERPDAVAAALVPWLEQL